MNDMPKLDDAPKLTINGDEFDCPFIDSLPSHASEELAGLEAGIAEKGVISPVIYARYNGRFVLIDGHTRARIAAKLGIGRIPTYEERYSSFEAMRLHALELNLHRRHLTREQRQELLARELKANPEQSDRSIAAKVGVSDQTVAAKRVQLESGAEIPHVESRKGKDGKPQPAKKPRPIPQKVKSPKPSPPPKPPGEPKEWSIEESVFDLQRLGAEFEFAESVERLKILNEIEAWVRDTRQAMQNAGMCEIEAMASTV